MSKILLTGYTSNVGKSLYQFLEKEHEVIGISRTSGYDLTKQEDFDSVLKLSLDCDCFINLAYIKTIQTDLLYSVYSLWEQQNKNGKIISVGSLGTNASFELHRKIKTDTELIANKLALEKMHNELSSKNPFGEQPQSILIRFALFNNDTKGIPYLKIEQLNEVFDFVLKSTTYISAIDFREIL